MIHGGGSTIETTFGNILPLLAVNGKVIALELQAHGHTSDRNSEESFEQDADDVAGLLDFLKIDNIARIPYLPIEFFKTHQVLSKNSTVDLIFESSGTSGMQRSKHYIHDQELYKSSFFTGFELFFGKPGEYVFVFLLPGYLENKSSSLLYMAKYLADGSKYHEIKFYLNDFE